MGSPALAGPRRDLRTPAAPPRKLPPRRDSGQLSVRPGAAPGGSRGRPRPAVGVPREWRALLLAPKAQQGSLRDPDWEEGGEAGRSAPPAGLRGLAPGPRLVRRVRESLATGDRPLGILPREVGPGARLSPSPRPASWRSGAQSRLDASLLRRPEGRVGVPGAATAARAGVASTSRSELCPRSRPIARVPQARPATSQPPPPPLLSRGGICARRGLHSRPLPPAALLKALNRPEQPSEVIDNSP